MAADPVDLDDVRETRPERIVYKPKTLTIPVPAGKALKIETTPDGEEFLNVEANGAGLEATIIVSFREMRE